jgi:hypothetical protein
MAEASKPRVFLSYSRKNATFVDELIISLESYGYEIMVDREDLFPGEQWEPRLRRLITEADTTVCVVSTEWVASDQCTKELQIALDHGRRVIPIIIDQLPPASLPEAIARLQLVFFTGDGRSYARGTADLVNALRTDIEWVREQSRFLDKALEWDATSRSTALLLRGAALERALAWTQARRPEHTQVVPLVAQFVSESQKAQDSDVKARLRGRLRTVFLIGLVGILGLSTAVLYINGERQRESQRAEVQEERADRNQQVIDFVERSAEVAAGEPLQSSAPPSVTDPSVDSRSAPSTSSIIEEQRQARAPTDLVSGLNAASASARIRAGQAIVDQIRRGDSAVVGRLVDQLEGDQLNALSASGRFNVLYMLNVYDGWASSPYADDLRAALDRMDARAGEGQAAIGGQTRDCIDHLRAKLAGQRGVGDRCGGR